MKKDNLDSLFERLQGEFDVAEPQNGHQERFLDKLNQSQGTIALNKKRPSWWKHLSIAASIALVAVLGYKTFGPDPSIKQQVVEIAPEVSQTEFYFANLIEEQVKELQDEKTPETAQLVDDTMTQLERLDKDYKSLQQDLINGGDSKIILSAMITNFQTRIDLLKEVLSQIENIKNLNSQNDESFTI
ncbi:DUF3379 domain-containing protein [Allomuricauda sp. XS_ASV26]|jgi:hypothetical protein|uniref:DUF4179 domain-containing protein n=1 Tax=Flagellimonas marinaquae TaxID=254955 RepID=A0AA48HDB7_9FLAO|nr:MULTISPECIES: DUF3379 domain-containing protein [Allomuricauda]MCA0959193.1 DUF3379 domain-containing protein [Allomuricauda ruestringensis]USD25472.1 DUF3379 domain-containing protein [Allomuricauda aquimarina]BDW91343.1 hypothetical protein MACH07_01750 [Allomuricauda aquimarina]